MDKTTGQSGASVPKDVLRGGTRPGNGVEEQAGVNRPVEACKYYDSDDSDPNDDGEVRAKGHGDSKKAGVPRYPQPGTAPLPAYYRTPQTQNTGGQQQQQPGRGQPSYPSAYAPQTSAYAQRPQPTNGYGQVGQFSPGAAPHAAQQQQQYPRPSHAPPPGGQSHAGYPHPGGYPKAGHPQASTANRYPAATQGQPSAQKPAPKKK